MHQERIKAYFADKETELCAAIARLIRIPSIKAEPEEGAPFGSACATVLEEALQLAAEWGLPGENLEGYVGTVDLNDKETKLHILAHLDVVAAGTGWTVTEAFQPLLQDGLLYGRGASDDKGPLVAALLAMRAVKDMQIQLFHNVRLILGTDEESGFHDIEWYYARNPYAPHSFSPDASFPLTNLEKGHLQPYLRKSWQKEQGGPRVCSLTGSEQVNMVPPTAAARLCGLSVPEVEPICAALEEALCVRFTLSEERGSLCLLSHGTATHASTPEEGSNALTALIALLCRLPLSDCESTRSLHQLHRFFPHGDHEGEALGLKQSDALSGALTITLSMITLEEEGLTARFDARTPLCATTESSVDLVRETLAPFGFTLEGTLTPAHYVPAESPFVQTLLRCYEQYSGQAGACLSMGGGTYVHGIPGGVAFGAAMPGFDSHLHGADERVSVAELLCACQIFTQTIVELCS